MNKNILIGIVLIVIVAAGVYFFANGTSMPGTAATSTDSMGTDITDNTNAGTEASAPRVVTDSKVSPTNSNAVVTGMVTPNGAQTTYWYEYGATTDLGQKTASQTIGSGWNAIASPGYITGLSANAQYYFRLNAKNALGTVNGTTHSFSTNNNPAGQGSAPTVNTNTASNVSRTGATLQASINPHSSQTTYWFEYGNNTDFGQVTSFVSAGTANASGARSASVSGLSPNTKYYFRVNAQNQYGTSNGSTQSFTTPGPAAVASPVVTTQVASPVEASTATLRGTVNPNGASTMYWFEYSTDSLLGSVLIKTTSRTSAGTNAGTVPVQTNVSSLQSGTTYYYQLVAQSSAGTVRGDKLTFKTK